MKKYMWVSCCDENGNNIGVILLEANDFMVVDFSEAEVVEDGEIEDVKRTPKNKFMTKVEMEKYVELGRV